MGKKVLCLRKILTCLEAFLDRGTDSHVKKGSLIEEKIHMCGNVPRLKKFLISVEEFPKCGKVFSCSDM